jgi:L-fuconolactonase
MAGLPIVPGGHQSWFEQILPLSELPNVVMKLSGYLGYSNPRPPSAEFLFPYLDRVLKLFGAHRLMFGSDWPVCTLGGPYEQTVSLIQPFLENLNQSDQSAIWSGTARRIYLKEGLI